MTRAEDEAMRDVVRVKNPPDDFPTVVNGGWARALVSAGARAGGVEGLDAAVGKTDKTVVAAIGVD